MAEGEGEQEQAVEFPLETEAEPAGPAAKPGGQGTNGGGEGEPGDKPAAPHREKLLDLGNGLSIWKVHLDALQEQDKNARVMAHGKFDRLVANIKKEKRLESLPLCCRMVNPAGNEVFSIISGHHRTRAARKAGVLEVHILAFEEPLTKDRVKAKQLAHNALEGEDDKQVLQQIFSEIEDLNAKLETGLTDDDLMQQLDAVSADNLSLDLDFEVVTLVFLPRDKQKFEDVVDVIHRDSAQVYVTDLPQFEPFKAAMRRVGREENIRAMPAIHRRMLEIVEEHYARKKAEAGAEAQGETGPAGDADGIPVEA